MTEQMTEALVIPYIVLVALNWILYHKIFHITYFGSLSKSLFNEFVGCLFAAGLEIAILMYLFQSVFGVVGNVVGAILRFIGGILKITIILAAIVAAIYGIYKLYLFLTKGKSNTVDKKSGQIEGLFNQFNGESRSKSDASVEGGTKISCPVCESQISVDDKFCISCGAKIDLDKEEHNQEKMPVQSEKEASDNMVCPVCGSPVNEGDKFCINCGKKM